jgi:hypothetical protein
MFVRLLEWKRTTDERDHTFIVKAGVMQLDSWGKWDFAAAAKIDAAQD